MLETFDRDPRLRTLPLAARALWLALMRAMHAAGASVLRFGSDVPDAKAVALLVSAAESELEANLPALLARGLLVREADGALASPMLAAASSRSEINRANGLKGGAARRRQALERRQREMPLMGVIDGGCGAAADVETEAEANADGSGPTAIAKLSKPKPKQAVDDAEFHRVGRAVMEAAGFDDARSMANYGCVRQWLADGWSESVILATVAAKTRPHVKSLSYFAPAIREAMERPAAPEELSPSSRALDAAISDWFVNGMQGRRPDPSEFRPGGSRWHEVAGARAA